MNKQGKLVNGKVIGGIEWVKWKNPDGTERRGYTVNPVGGCKHKCRWTMPDGSIAICYAEDVAGGVAEAAYPHGFESHYWRPGALDEPERIKQPARIFIDSMSDLFGIWVKDDEIRAVLEMCRRAHWHTFLSLTKNAPRLLKFSSEFPANLHIGVSTPPDHMHGRALTLAQKIRMLETSLEILAKVGEHVPVVWVSVEPLSWDVAPIFAAHKSVKWGVTGAASSGKVKYQPDPAHVQALLDVWDAQGVPIFFKGNLIWPVWREEYPRVEETHAQ